MVSKSYIAVILLACSAFAQQFTVRGEDKHYDQVEAQKAYWYSVEALRVDLHSREPLTPTFTLVLGAEKSGVDYDKHEIQLRKWDRVLFEQGVLILAIEELHKPAYLTELLKRIEAQQEAAVDVHSLQH